MSFGPFKANFGILEAHGDTSEEESEHDRFYSNKHSASELFLGLLEQISEFLNRMEPRQKRKASRLGEQPRGPEKAGKRSRSLEKAQKSQKRLGRGPEATIFTGNPWKRCFGLLTGNPWKRCFGLLEQSQKKKLFSVGNPPSCKT